MSSTDAMAKDPRAPNPEKPKRPKTDWEAIERDYRAGQLHVTFNLPVSKIAAWRDKDAAALRLALQSAPPHREAFAVLVEGGHDAWTAEGARRYARGGGLRVLFACGRASCRASAEHAAVQLKAAGVQSRVVYAAEQGHTYDGGVQTVIAAALPWLLSDDLAAQP